MSCNSRWPVFDELIPVEIDTPLIVKLLANIDPGLVLFKRKEILPEEFTNTTSGLPSLLISIEFTCFDGSA